MNPLAAAGLSTPSSSSAVRFDHQSSRPQNSPEYYGRVGGLLPALAWRSSEFECCQQILKPHFRTLLSIFKTRAKTTRTMPEHCRIRTNWPEIFIPSASHGIYEFCSPPHSETSYGSEHFKRTASDSPSPPNATAKRPIEQVDLTRSDHDENSDSSSGQRDVSSRRDVATTAMDSHQAEVRAERAPIQFNTTAEAPEQHLRNFNQGIASSSKDPNTTTASADSDSIPDVTPLSSNHETKYLRQARLQFVSERPPFVRLNRSELPRTVTVALRDGNLPQTAVLAT